VDLPADIGWTGLLTAHMRAVESARPDRLFTDPLAEAVVDVVRHAIRTDPDAALPTGPAPGTGELTETWSMLSTYLGVRTAYYDRVVREAAAEGIRQVVVLAAGFDARAFRLGLPPETAFFELDTEPVLRFKETVLAGAALTAGVRRHAVPVDLRGPWQEALTRSGFTPEVPTMWLVEGLFMYLSAADSDALLAHVSALSAPGSRMALEYYEDSPRVADAGASDPVEVAIIERIVGFFRSGPPLPPDRWLASHGWAADVSTLAAEITAPERPLPLMFQAGRPHEVNLWLAEGRLR
jgi:methyltransferase (TIGR00027 family)